MSTAQEKNAVARAGLELPDAGTTSRIGIVGVSGSGKSNRAKKWLRRQLERKARVAFFDPFNEYSQKGHATGQVRLGPLRDCVTAEDLDCNPRMLDRDDLSLAVVPTSKDVDVQAQEFAAFVEHCMNTGDLQCGADELGRYAFENAKAHAAQKALNELMTTGRHYSVGAMVVSQRLMHVAKTARTQLVAVEFFSQTDPDDLEAAAKLTAIKGELNWTLAAEVSELQPHHSRVWVSAMGQGQGQ